MSIFSFRTRPIAAGSASIRSGGIRICLCLGLLLSVSHGVAEDRFTIVETDDVADGTVLDNLTGLTWLRDAECFGLATYEQAKAFASGLTGGSCGLSPDVTHRWRLPTIEELESLRAGAPPEHPFEDPNFPDTAGTGQWSDGDAFFNLQSGDTPVGNAPLDLYWSSSEEICGLGYSRTMSYYQGFSLACFPTDSTAYLMLVKHEPVLTASHEKVWANGHEQVEILARVLNPDGTPVVGTSVQLF